MGGSFPTKDGRTERGSGALRGAADLMVNVSKDSHDVITLEGDKEKDFLVDPVTFRIKAEHLGHDEHGEPITGVRAITDDRTVSVAGPKRLALDLFTDGITDVLSNIAPPEGVTSGKLADVWTAESGEQKWKFYRYITEAVKKGLVSSAGSGPSRRYHLPGVLGKPSANKDTHDTDGQ